jgi:hypothetical protein
MAGDNFKKQLPPDLQGVLGKVLQRKLPDGRVIKFVVGDVTGDGVVDQEDIDILRMLCKGGSTAEKLFSSLTPEQLAACDITGDGFINAEDLISLCKKMADQDQKMRNESKLNNLRNKLKD